MTDASPPAIWRRLMDLARREAHRLHWKAHASWSHHEFPNDRLVDGHRFWPEAHFGDGGFRSCPHPDCAGLRACAEALAPAPNVDAILKALSPWLKHNSRGALCCADACFCGMLKAIYELKAADALAPPSTEADELREQLEFQRARADKWVAVAERYGLEIEQLKESADALAPAPDKAQETGADTRRGNQAERDRLQSSAPTDGDVSTPAPNRPFQSCQCPAAHGEDCPLTQDECEARTRDYVGLPWFGARLRRIWEGFLSESLNGVVCSIPDSGLNTPAHRTWCLRCQRRYMELKALVDMLDSRTDALAPPEPGWQPIATAPKDGRRLLMFLGDDDLFPDPCILRWGIEGDGEDEYWIDAEEFAPDPQPTHWMPLPAPPRADALEAPPDEQRRK